MAALAFWRSVLLVSLLGKLISTRRLKPKTEAGH
jgi:hypothetical protein